MGEDETRAQEAPFNMAVATLKRLDAILTQIRVLDHMHPYDSAAKQKSHLGLTKQFFINSIPLLKEEVIKDYQEKVLSLDNIKKSVVKSGGQKVVYSFDKKLEKEANQILIDLQKEIKPYFMPKGKDPSKAVAQF